MSEFTVGDSYYEVLDVDSSASASEVKQAWVEKTRDVHADKTGDSEQYEYLLDAGKVLRDSERREAYDVLGHDEFVAKYGRRGNKRSISSRDRQENTSSKSTGSTTTSTSSTSNNQTSGTDTENSNSKSSGSSSHNNTTGTGQGKNSNSSQSSSKSNSNRRQSKTDSDPSDQADKDTTSSTDQSLSFFRELVDEWFVTPGRSYPVLSRLSGVMLSIVFVWIISNQMGYAGTAVELLGMIVLASVSLLLIRGPKRSDHSRPETSDWLIKVPIKKLSVLMIVATGVAALGDFPIMSMFEISTGISITFLVRLLFAGLNLAFVGAVLSILIPKVSMKQAIFFFGGIGVAQFPVNVGLGWGSSSREPPMSRVGATLGETYPWGILESITVAFIDLPLLLTIVLAVITGVPVLIGTSLSLLVVLHDSAQHDRRGRYIPPIVWEVGVGAVLVTLSWSYVYGAPHTTLLLGDFMTPYVTSQYEVFIIWWATTVTLVTVFAFLSPRYTCWRE